MPIFHLKISNSCQNRHQMVKMWNKCSKEAALTRKGQHLSQREDKNSEEAHSPTFIHLFPLTGLRGLPNQGSNDHEKKSSWG